MKLLLTIFLVTMVIASFGTDNGSIFLSQNNKSGAIDDSLSQLKDLALDLKVLNDSQITVSVKNASNKTLRAYSYVETHERHYDYFEIEVLTPDNDRMVFVFYDDREKSASVVVELKPGESFSHTIDFVKWAGRSVNSETLKSAGLNHLPHGVKIRAKYLNSPCDNCNAYYKSIWTGYLYSDWVSF